MLTKTVMEVICAAEHLDDERMGHLVSILVWSSYCSGVDVFLGSVTSFTDEIIDCQNNFLSLERPNQSDLSDINLKIQKIKQSRYYQHSIYLQVIIDLLVQLFEDSAMALPDIKMYNILRWRFGCTAKDLCSVVFLANELFTEKKYSVLLQFLQESSQSFPNIPVFTEFLLWNTAVTLSKLGEEVQCTAILELCSKTFHPEIVLCTVRYQKNNAASSVAVLQQLACKNLSFQNRKKYCNRLKDIFSNDSNLCKYYVALCSSDLAYMTEDYNTQLELSLKLQSYDLANILENNCVEERNSRQLASCCVLLSQSYSYLDKNDLQKSYELFMLSFNQAKELKGNGFPWFNIIKDRYLAQLFSLEGHFLVLQGQFDAAAIAYGKSYSHDSYLVMSLYNQCLLFLKLGKVKLAKRNWTLAYEVEHMCFYSSEHCFSRLNLYLKSH
jgi:hypothetical protein